MTASLKQILAMALAALILLAPTGVSSRATGETAFPGQAPSVTAAEHSGKAGGEAETGTGAEKGAETGVEENAEKIISEQQFRSAPKAIEITGSKYVARGKKITLKARVIPDSANQDVKWVSGNTKIAIVTSSGVVLGKKAGTVKITAVSRANKKVKAAFKVKVMAKAVTKVTVTSPVKTVDLAGLGSKTVTLTAKASPAQAAQSFKWSSSNKKVAKVSNDGVVTCIGTGSVKITATATDGSKKKASVTIRVTDSADTPDSEIKVISQPQDVTAYEGETVSFTFNVSGSGIQYQWYYAFPGDTEWTKFAYKTQATCSFTLEPGSSGLQLMCMATDSHGNYVQSDSAIVKIPLTIRQQPQSTWAYAGEQAVFHIETTGATSYKWFFCFAGGTEWQEFYGNTNSDTFILQVQQHDDGLSVVCMAYNPFGESVQSETVYLSVPVKPVFRALLIANGAYPGDTALPGTYVEVQALKYALENALRYPYHVSTYQDCTSDQILNAISSAYSGATDTDISLFYFSGHGGDAATNTDPYSGAFACMNDSWVTPVQLAGALGAVPGRIIVIIACCHSGAHIGTGTPVSASAGLSDFNRALIRELKKYKLPQTGIQSNFGELANDKFIVLTCCRSTEQGIVFVHEGSPFTMAISESMGCTWPGTAYSGNSPADKDQNKIITLGECWSYAAIRQKELIPAEHNAQYYGDKSFPLFILK